MLSGIGRKLVLVLLLVICCSFGQIACAQQSASQRDKERIEQVAKHEEAAKQLRLKNDFQGALQEQQKAVELNPDDSESLMLLGGIYIELEQSDKAIITLKKGEQLNPQNAWIHYLMVQALEQSGDKVKALSERKESVKLAPRNTLFLVNLGVAQELSGDNKSALETYNQALKVNLNYIYGVCRLGLLEAEEGNSQRARELFQRGIEFKPAEDGDEVFIRLMKEKLNILDRK